MKKIALSALVAATLVSAADFNYEITPVAGYLWNQGAHEDHSGANGVDNLNYETGGIQNHGVYGLEMQFNNIFDVIKPELSVLYGTDRIANSGDDSQIWTGMLNGVYEIDTDSIFTPFIKAGLGYEYEYGILPSEWDGLILDAGIGSKIDLTKHIALKVEGLYFWKDNNGHDEKVHSGQNGQVHNLALLAGLTFSFDEKEVAVAPVVAAAAVVVAAEPAPAPVVVPAPVVAAPVEKCPNAPKGFVLDDNCAPLKKSFNINFPFNSAEIIASEAPKVAEFATFLKDSPAYKTELVGYTDSVGAEKYNQKLSEKRSAAVKAQLEKEGVAADRLSTSGKGEADAVADNKTKEGRWLNRRVDAVLAQ